MECNNPNWFLEPVKWNDHAMQLTISKWHKKFSGLFVNMFIAAV